MTTPLVSAALALNLTGVLSPFLETPSRKAREGNARYAVGDWEGAAERYAEAASTAKDGAYAYNLGTANYRKREYPGAIDALSRAAEDAKLDLGQVAYNLGNAKFQSGDLEGALGAYRAALSAHPEDEDARSNYELTLRELQRQQQNQDQNQRQNQNEESDQNDQQKQDQKNQENQEGESDQDSQQDQKDQSGEKKESEEG
ncbi:MAG TPA: tetratricopeptide repeat protein, partial [Candidatus Eisenbacteria bacterium]|nr:tetratricopeptide repeat protein [Candidatus Eisenbacteria bacterium]